MLQIVPKRVFRILTCLVAWCAIASLAFGESKPEFLTIHTEVGGEFAGTIRILTWDGGRPDIIEIVDSDGRSIRTISDRRFFGMMTLREEPRSRDGSLYGSVSIPTALGSVTYELQAHTNADGTIEAIINQQGAPENQLHAVALLPEPRGDETVSPQNALIPIFVAFMLDWCAERQERALNACQAGAIAGCGAGNVGDFEYSGGCGQGSCSWSCQ